MYIYEDNIYLTLNIQSWYFYITILLTPAGFNYAPKSDLNKLILF